MKNKLKLWSLIFFFFAVSACKKDDTVISSPPLMPPRAAFVMDFTGYKYLHQTKTYTNFNIAVTNVKPWYKLMEEILFIPFAAYKEALYVTPIKIDANSWQWEFDFTIEKAYKGKLKSLRNGDNIEWKMYVSKAGEFSDFLWYEGTTDYFATKASWLIYDSPAVPRKIIGVEWILNEDKTYSLEYKNIANGGRDFGSFIKYSTNVADEFNKSFDVYDKLNEHLSKIEWTKDNVSGRLQDSFSYGNSDWYCWNEDYQDTDCK